MRGGPRVPDDDLAPAAAVSQGSNC